VETRPRTGPTRIGQPTGAGAKFITTLVNKDRPDIREKNPLPNIIAAARMAVVSIPPTPDLVALND